MNGVVHLTILFLLACYSAFSVPCATPETARETNKVTIQKYTPDIYKKKRQRPPVRRKMVLVSQVTLQADESCESHSSSALQHFSAGMLSAINNDFWFRALRKALNFANYVDFWPFWSLPPDSPPPQSV